MHGQKSYQKHQADLATRGHARIAKDVFLFVLVQKATETISSI